MSRPLRFAGSMSLLIFVAACTQPVARVEFKGQDNFSRSGGGSNASYSSYNSPPAEKSNYVSYKPAPVYANTKPVSLHTEQSASVSSIGVSDLSPPAKTDDKPQSSSNVAPTNQWTKKPRGGEEASNQQPAAVQKPKPEVKVAQAPKAKPGTFMWPVASHKLLSGFGPKGGGKSNDGINIASPDNEPVWASADGEVVYVGDMQGYGNMILLKHSGGKTTSYAHLGRATVDKYDRVKQGDIIGYVGNSGGVKKPQLHFAMRDGQLPIDPKKYLSTNLASN